MMKMVIWDRIKKKREELWLTQALKLNNVQEQLWAIQKINNPDKLLYIAHQLDYFVTVDAALNRVNDQRLLAEFAQSSTIKWKKIAAVRRISNQGLLGKIASIESDTDILTAIQCQCTGHHFVGCICGRCGFEQHDWVETRHYDEKDDGGVILLSSWTETVCAKCGKSR